MYHINALLFLIFSGSECGIVLLSTVRSLPLEFINDPKALTPDRGWLNENLGFLTNQHIINVGITRCQYGLIIVGKYTVPFKCCIKYGIKFKVIKLCWNMTKPGVT